MKIFYDFKIFFNQTYGGPSRYFASLVNCLGDKNSDFLIYSPFFKNNYLRYLKNKFPRNIKGTYISKNYKHTNKILYFYNFYRSSIKINLLEYDIHHPTYFGKDIFKIKKKPIVLTVYDLIHEKIKKNYTSLDDKSKLLHRADHIICISKNTQNDLIEYYNIDEAKTSVIYPGYENIFTEKIKKKIDLNYAKPYLLYVGTRNEYKNYKNFLKSYSTSKKLMNDFNIVFFGGGNFSLEEINYIKKLNIPTITT